MAGKKNTLDGEGLEREPTVSGLEPPVGAAEDSAPFTDAEVEGFAQRLRTWGDALPAREQELLARLVLAPPGAENDVGGYVWGMWPSASASLSEKVWAAAQDVTVNKAKTADKAFKAMDAYIRG